jgi:hypothetical protein
MSQELHYTSVPRGLKPGSRGFCTVAATPQMSSVLADRLECLSGYQPVFPSHDPSAALNPIVYSHLRLTVAGRVLSVISRIGPAGLDYSGRPNKYAHHVVLEQSERPAGSPAWLLSQPGFMQSGWAGEPRELSAGRTPPMGDRPSAMARAWQTVTGDAGWAGVLAESFLIDSKRPALILFAPGTDMLLLLSEALALLPRARRWDVEFSTYFTQLPIGTNCIWRCMVAGSAEANRALRIPNALVIDLCRPLDTAEGGALVQMARTGKSVDAPEIKPTAPIFIGTSIGAGPPAGPWVPSVRHATPTRQAGPTAGYELIPEMAARMKPRGALPKGDSSGKSARRPKGLWLLFGGLAAACLILALAAAVFTRQTDEQNIGRLLESAKTEERVGTAVISAGASWEAEPALEREHAQSKPQFDIPANPFAEPWNADVRLLPRPNPDAERIEASGHPSGQTRGAQNQARHGQGLVARIYSIPLTRGSGLTFRGTKKPTYGLDRDISDVDVLPTEGAGVGITKALGGREIQIRKNSVPLKGFEPTVAAKFTFDHRELSFCWEPGVDQAPEMAAAVLDAVLRIHFVGGGTEYVLLRDPQVHKQPGALSLHKSPGRRQMALSWTTSWAAADGLKATGWRLLIRRWRVEYRLGNETARLLGCSESDSESKTSDAQPMRVPRIRNASLAVKIGEPDSHNIQVRIETGRQFKNDRATLEKSINEIASSWMASTDVSNGDLFAMGAKLKLSLDAQLKVLQDQPPDDSQPDRVSDMKKDIRRMEQLLADAKVYSLLDELERGDPKAELKLSVIICLMLEDGQKLNVAAFGEFPPEKM